MRRVASLLAPLLLAAAAVEGAVTLRTEVTPRELTIGDRIQIRVSVAHSTDLAPVPFTPPTPLGELDVLDFRTTPGKESAGKRTLEHTLIATTFSTGAVTVPALSLIFSLPDGTTAEAKTAPVDLDVKSVLAQEGDQGGLRPMKGLIDFRSYAWLWWVAGAAAIVGAILGFRWWRKRKQDALLNAPPRPPEIVAWEAIHALEDDNLIEQGDIKEFYSRLSIVLRTYLESRYKIAALESTTTELLSDFRKLSLPVDVTERARVFLDNADLAKFARMTPTAEEIADDLTRVKEVINATTPQPEPRKPAEAEDEAIPV